MADALRFGPQLALLIAAGLIIILDVCLRPGAEFAARRRAAAVVLALVGAAASLICSLALILADEKGSSFHGLLLVDDYSLFFDFLFAGVAAVIVLASVDFLERIRFPAEYLTLVLASAVGMMLMASSEDLIAIFVALELQSIAFYVLVGFLKDARSSEASLKYLLLGAISTALTLYGMAYLFGLSGSTNLNDIAAFVDGAGSGSRSALVLAAVFLAAGLGFKMAVVPFQMWVPDVYQGAPTPVTAYLSVASKAAGFAVVMRIFVVALGHGLIEHVCRHRCHLDDLGQRPRPNAGEHQADARIQLHRPGGYVPDRTGCGGSPGPSAAAWYERRRVFPRHLRVH